MAAEAGVKSADFYANHIYDNYREIEGYNRRWQKDMEKVRLSCFFIAKFGNSDPRKVKTPQDVMPFDWDKQKRRNKSKKTSQEIHEENQRLKEEAKARKAAKAGIIIPNQQWLSNTDAYKSALKKIS